MLTKKHYKTIAGIIKLHIDCAGPLTVNSYISVANQLADMCENDNPNFNRSKFLQACGVSTSTEITHVC